MFMASTCSDHMSIKTVFINIWAEIDKAVTTSATPQTLRPDLRNQLTDISLFARLYRFFWLGNHRRHKLRQRRFIPSILIKLAVLRLAQRSQQVGEWVLYAAASDAPGRVIKRVLAQCGWHVLHRLQDKLFFGMRQWAFWRPVRR